MRLPLALLQVNKVSGLGVPLAATPLIAHNWPVLSNWMLEMLSPVPPTLNSPSSVTVPAERLIVPR
jgi:hypothetical protein